jgi:hypothetical protein
MLNSVAQWRVTEDFEYPVAVGGNRLGPSFILPLLPSRTVDHGHTLAGLADQTYLVTLKPPSVATQHVVASVAGVRGDHLVFVGAHGELAALFLLELVQSWEVLPALDGRP